MHGRHDSDYEILFRKTEGKKLLGRHKCIQKYDTTMYLKEMVKKWKGVDWVYLAGVGDRWQAVVNVIMNFPKDCAPWS